jgi:hypothetical protein
VTSRSYVVDAGVVARPSALSPAWWLGLPLAVAFASFVASRFPDWHERAFANEPGILETAQVLILIAAIVAGAMILRLPRTKARPWLTAWIGLAVAGCFYTAGEEISWGQHMFGWTTPESWAAINKQNETNLHNVTSWFNQKPRALLETGVVTGGIVLPLLMRWRPGLVRGWLALIAPPLLVLPTALLAELTRLVDTAAVTSALGFHVFLRASEVQEALFYIFALLYLVAMHRRLSGEGLPG